MVKVYNTHTNTHTHTHTQTHIHTHKYTHTQTAALILYPKIMGTFDRLKNLT